MVINPLKTHHLKSSKWGGSGTWCRGFLKVTSRCSFKVVCFPYLVPLLFLFVPWFLWPCFFKVICLLFVVPLLLFVPFAFFVANLFVSSLSLCYVWCCLFLLFLCIAFLCCTLLMLLFVEVCLHVFACLDPWCFLYQKQAISHCAESPTSCLQIAVFERFSSCQWIAVVVYYLKHLVDIAWKPLNS